MTEYDVLIKNGMLFDGLRSPRRITDVGIRNGRVVDIGRLRASDARQVLDATGLHVAPGFVDLHTHYDSQLFWDPYCSISGWHGVTSVAIGNCGFGFAPVAPEHRTRAMLSMTRNEAVPLACMEAGMPWDWVTFPEFLDSVNRAPKSVNVLPYLPMTPVLVWAMGLDRAKEGVLPTEAEHDVMRGVLREAMDAGACGFTAQRYGSRSAQRDYDGTPMPTDLIHDETIFTLADVLAERNDGIMQYYYLDLASSNPFHEGVRKHLEQVVERSGRPLIYNAVRASGKGWDDGSDWGRQVLQRGLPIYGQANLNLHPGFVTRLYDDFILADLSPVWMSVMIGTPDEKMTRLADPTIRAAMRAELDLVGIVNADFGDWVVFRGQTPETAQFDEMKISQIAAITGKDPLDAFCDIALADQLTTRFFLPQRGFEPDTLREFLADEYILPGVSDGGAHTKYSTEGGYATDFLAKFVREWDWLTVEDAHWRLSAYSAHCAGIKDRGSITIGAPADIIVYDFEQLEKLPDEIAYDYPGEEWRLIAKARGYRYVLVNGVVTIEDDAPLHRHPGALLRNGKAANVT